MNSNPPKYTQGKKIKIPNGGLTSPKDKLISQPN
jgi:hypothetical protein